MSPAVPVDPARQIGTLTFEEADALLGLGHIGLDRCGLPGDAQGSDRLFRRSKDDFVV
jgi:hypothetical protein